MSAQHPVVGGRQPLQWDLGSIRRVNANLKGVGRRIMTAGLKRAGAVVAAAVIDDAKTVSPTIPKGPAPMGGTLREAGRFSVTREGYGILITIRYDLPYAAPMHNGFWVTGPLAGVHVRNWTQPGSGPHWLSEKLRRFRQKYINLAAAEIGRGAGLRS